MKSFEELRKRMVEGQLRARGITDERVLRAFLEVPREEFVPDEQKEHAYEDKPLPIGFGQTISQPYMAAVMTALLHPEREGKVLEVGTGSGYQAAILSKLAGEVVSVEIIPELARRARETLKKLGVKNCEVVVGDGSAGYPAEAPYDAIIVTAGAPSIPEELLRQLRNNGCLVAPVGDLFGQVLVRITRKKNSFRREEFFPCAFVPLRGVKGWK